MSVIVVEALHYLLNLLLVDKRLVALYVYYHIGSRAAVAVGFEATVCAAPVAFACHYDTSAEAFHLFENPAVVGCNDGVSEHFGHLPPHAFYHCLSAYLSQCFPRKTR